jgi:L-ascorbate metabolism protein UlaG (beta-lactamase superfamily)
MHLTHLGHACVLIEIDGTGVLIDPGSLSTATNARGVDAMLFTHSHVDHLDTGAVAELLRSNSPSDIVADAASAQILHDSGIRDVTVVDTPGTAQLDVGGVGISATTVPHASIHCDLPSPVNNTYLLGDTILHPGDAFWKPDRPVPVLLLPIGGPWMKLSESIDYLRAVSPQVAIPIHQGGLAAAHRALHFDLLTKLAPAGTRLLPLTEGERTVVRCPE